MATAVGALRVDLSANTAAFFRDMGKAAKAVMSGSARMNKALTRVHRNLTLGAKKMKSFAGTMLPLKSMFAGLVAGGLVIATKKALDTADAIGKTADIFIPDADEPGLGRLEAALHLVVGAKDANAKVKDAVRAGALDKEPLATLIERAVVQKVIKADEYERLQAAEAARDDVIQVDQFDPETHAGIRG